MAGIKGYERKVQRCIKEGRQLYRTAKDSRSSRARKKIMGKSEWFRTKKNKELEEEKAVTGKGSWRGEREVGRLSPPGQAVKMKTRTVLFVEHTPGGELSSRLRAVLYKNEAALGFRVKVVRPWQGSSH